MDPEPGPVAMRQEWRDLLFVHWSVPTDALRPLVPNELEIDTFDGAAHIGLVPFGMHRVRPAGLPAVPWLSDFLECNVRTYVRHPIAGPGVWFFSLDAAQPVAVGLARAIWHLPYHLARMERSTTGERHEYRTHRVRGGGRAQCEWSPATDRAPSPAEQGTLDHHLVERYTLFARTRKGLAAGRVRHSPYAIVPARLHRLEEDLIRSAGVAVTGSPLVAHMSPGVMVDVEPLRTISN